MADSILINGEIHDWTDVVVKFMGGVEFRGLSSINYSSTKEKELQYGSGTTPSGVGYGHRSAKADFSMSLQSAQEFESIARLAGKDPLDYAPFLIVISYADKQVSGDFVEQKHGTKIVTLTDVDITDMETSQDEATKKVERKYTALVGKIIGTV